jgi:hypothetical protein
MKMITQFLTFQQLEKLKAITDSTGLKRAELIRTAIELLIKKYDDI